MAWMELNHFYSQQSQSQVCIACFCTLASHLIGFPDKEEAAGDLGFGGQLGEIQIRVVRSEPKEQIEWVPSTIQETRNFGTIHETAKKAGMHCVS